MNIKKNGLKSLAAAAVIAMVSANASAQVVSAVTANGSYGLGPSVAPIPGMMTPAFSHPGGQLVAMYSAECTAFSEPAYGLARVDVNIVVSDAADQVVAILSPTDNNVSFCSSGAATGSYSMTGVGTLPRGTYRVSARAGFVHLAKTQSGWMGARSLVVLR